MKRIFWRCVTLAMLAIISFMCVGFVAAILLAVESVVGIPWLRESINLENYAIGVFVAAFVCHTRYSFALYTSTMHGERDTWPIIVKYWMYIWTSWLYVAYYVITEFIECTEIVTIWRYFRNKWRDKRVINKSTNDE